MINGIQFKVCGLNRVEDAVVAAEAGADYLGFIFYQKSPRNIDLESFRRIASSLPSVPKVAVTVVPSLEALQAYQDAGFDYFQIHFPLERRDQVESWSRTVGKERLWLAPKWPPHSEIDPAMLDWAGTVVWDAYKREPDTFGGTGMRSDWAMFRALRETHRAHRWVLAGGLSPENAVEALASSGAEILDFNSGLEIAPGQKDPERILSVREVLAAKGLSTREI